MPGEDSEMQLRALLEDDENRRELAPSSLKARLYSTLVRKQQESGSLASLDSSVSAGRGVCVFEKLVQIAPIPDAAKTPFFCQACHARVLAEHLENPPIFWANCPYVQFKL